MRALTKAAWAIGIWAAPALLAAQQPAGTRDSAHRAMQAQMQEWDRRMEQKLAEVDRAKGDKKVTAMAAAMRELMAQRREMHDRMAHERPGPAGAPCAAMQSAGPCPCGQAGGCAMGPGAGHGAHPMPGAARGGPCPMHAPADSGAGR
jgi:hypothetical protein